MKITTQRLQKEALEIPDQYPMQPFAALKLSPRPRQTILWFINYVDAKCNGIDPDLRCFVCGNKSVSFSAATNHYVMTHLDPELEKKGKTP